MRQRNDTPIKYKGQTIWTNSTLLRIFTLSLVDEIRTMDPSTKWILKSFYIDFNIESIFSGEAELKLVKQAVAQLNTKAIDKAYLATNILAQRMAATIKSTTPGVGNKELGKELTEFSRIRPDAVKELFCQVENLLNEKEIFQTEEDVLMEELLGRWQTRTIINTLEFDINFNMTDFSPGQQAMLEIYKREQNTFGVDVFVPALDASTSKSVQLKLISGSVLLNKGMLFITEGDGGTHKMPVRQAKGGYLDTYLFKTRIIFERVDEWRVNTTD